MAENETPERKDVGERRVYTLPLELLARLRAYQLSQNIPSEVEAARRLLDSALQLRDTIEDILIRLRERFSEEKDLRMLASDVLVKHHLVESITINDDGLVFYLRNGDGGRIDQKGTLRQGTREYGEDSWSRFQLPTEVKAKPSQSKSGWDNGGGGDLDDEIPF
ncbi:MAG: hypothetical protein ACRYG8_06325 [Janthinobacterium lividum]